MKKPVSHDKAVSRLANTLKGHFAAGMMPNGEFTPEELNILQQRWMDNGMLPCVYCGKDFHCWDHLHAIRSKGTWSGYPNTIDNLVPACARCNDSKSGANWKSWFLGKAKNSPLNRERRGESFGIDLSSVPARIDEYEAKVGLKKIDLDIERKNDSNLDSLLKEYENLRNEIISKIEPAQESADKVRTFFEAMISKNS